MGSACMRQTANAMTSWIPELLVNYIVTAPLGGASTLQSSPQGRTGTTNLDSTHQTYNHETEGIRGMERYVRMSGYRRMDTSWIRS